MRASLLLAILLVLAASGLDSSSVQSTSRSSQEGSDVLDNDVSLRDQDAGFSSALSGDEIRLRRADITQRAPVINIVNNLIREADPGMPASAIGDIGPQGPQGPRGPQGLPGREAGYATPEFLYDSDNDGDSCANICHNKCGSALVAPSDLIQDADGKIGAVLGGKGGGGKGDAGGKGGKGEGDDGGGEKEQLEQQAENDAAKAEQEAAKAEQEAAAAEEAQQKAEAAAEQAEKAEDGAAEQDLVTAKAEEGKAEQEALKAEQEAERLNLQARQDENMAETLEAKAEKEAGQAGAYADRQQNVVQEVSTVAADAKELAQEANQAAQDAQGVTELQDSDDGRLDDYDSGAARMGSINQYSSKMAHLYARQECISTCMVDCTK